MDLQIQGRNLEISDQIKEHITKKLGLIDRHLPNIGRADVEIASEATRAQKDRVVVQVTLNVSGTLLRAQHAPRTPKPQPTPWHRYWTAILSATRGRCTAASARPEGPLS